MATMLPPYQRGMIVQQSSTGGGQQPGGGYHDTHLQVVAGLRSSSNRSNRRCSSSGSSRMPVGSSGSSRMPVAGEAIIDTAIFESLYNDGTCLTSTCPVVMMLLAGKVTRACVSSRACPLSEPWREHSRSSAGVQQESAVL